MKFGVVLFPGSNCDDDLMHVIGEVYLQRIKKIWHKETSLVGFNPGDCIFIPGGFSYGDYLRLRWWLCTQVSFLHFTTLPSRGSL